MSQKRLFDPLASLNVVRVGDSYFTTNAREPASKSALSGEADVMMISGLKGTRASPLGQTSIALDNLPWWGWFVAGAVAAGAVWWLLKK